MPDGLALWLRSDRGISTDTNTTTTVSLWADQSGNGRDLGQGSKSLQPLYVTGGLNGLPVLRFDGVGTYLKAAYSAGLLATRAALFVVYKPTANQTNFAAGLPYSDNTSWVDPYVGIHLGQTAAGSNGRFWMNSGATNAEFQAGAMNTGTFYTQAISYDGSNMIGYVNGTSVNSAAMTVDPSYSGQPRFVVGTRSADALGEYLGGDIAEIIFYNSTLSEVNRLKVETYLNSKYSIY